MDNEELMNVIMAYDRYIQEANYNDWYSQGWKPITISEFYETLYDYYNLEKVYVVG